MNPGSTPDIGIPAAAPDAGREEPIGLARLEDLLCRELDCYRDLLDVMLKEKEVLSTNRNEELGELLEEQKRVLFSAKSIEPRRREAMAALVGELSLEHGSTLHQIAGSLDGAARERVLKLRGSLTHIVERVDQVNRINVMLIRNNLDFIGTTVRAILEESTPQSTYAPTGKSAQREVLSWTDRHA